VKDLLKREHLFAFDPLGASVDLLASILPHLKLSPSHVKTRFCNANAAPFSRLRRRELPSKTIAKNIEQIITYPHSDSKRFENAAAAGSRVNFL